MYIAPEVESLQISSECTEKEWMGYQRVGEDGVQYCQLRLHAETGAGGGE